MGERRSLLDTDRQDRLHIDATGHRAVTAALQHGLKEEDGPHAIPHGPSLCGGNFSMAHSMGEIQAFSCRMPVRKCTVQEEVMLLTGRRDKKCSVR